MIRLRIDGMSIPLPSGWHELKQVDACKILELREMGLKKNIFYWQVLKLLLEMPTTWKAQVIYFLFRFKWFQFFLNEKMMKIFALWKLVAKADEDDQLTLLQFMTWTEEKPVLKKAANIDIDVSDFMEHYHQRGRWRRPADDGANLDFETLLDAIHYFSAYCRNQDEEDLCKLIAVLYFRVEGNYDPVYLGYAAGKVKALPYGLKLYIRQWFADIFETIVEVHPDVFPKPVEGEEPKPDPYGLAGFMHRMAGKQFGPLEQLKRTRGIEVLDGFQIEITDLKERTKPTPQPETV